MANHHHHHAASDTKPGAKTATDPVCGMQVEIKESDDADTIFTALMGDLVEPRRDFIQDNALSVANLDV